MQCFFAAKMRTLALLLALAVAASAAQPVPLTEEQQQAVRSGPFLAQPRRASSAALAPTAPHAAPAGVSGAGRRLQSLPSSPSPAAAAPDYCLSTIASKPPASSMESDATDLTSTLQIGWVSMIYHRDPSQIFTPCGTGTTGQYVGMCEIGPTYFLNLVLGGAAATTDSRVATDFQLSGATFSATEWPVGNMYIAGGNSVYRVNTNNGIGSLVAFQNNVNGYADGVATSAMAQNWLSIAVAKDGTQIVYVADIWNSVIRRIDVDAGIVTTFAGSFCASNCVPFQDKVISGDGGPATAATLNYPWGIDTDYQNQYVYVLDSWFHRLRRVSIATGVITTVAGKGIRGSDNLPYNGDDQLATLATLSVPRSMKLAPNGDAYIMDSDYSLLRKVSAATGIISRVAGLPRNFSWGPYGVPALNVPIGGAWSVHVAQDYSITIGGAPDNMQLLITPDGMMNTIGPVRSQYLAASTAVAGFHFSAMNTSLSSMNSLATYPSDRTRVLVSMSSFIYEFSPFTNSLRVIAGTPGTTGYSGDGGPALLALLNNPVGMSVDSRNVIYFSDSNNFVIRRISALGIISTIAGTGKEGKIIVNGAAALTAQFVSVKYVFLDEPRNRLLLSDFWANCISSISLLTNTINTIAGNCTFPETEGICYQIGNGGPATSALLMMPMSVVAASNGDVFVAERGNHVVRKITYATGVISNYVGQACTPGTIVGTTTTTGDPNSFNNYTSGTLFNYAEMYSPRGLLIDAYGNMVISDDSMNLLWNASGGVIRVMSGFIRGDIRVSARILLSASTPAGKAKPFW